MNVTEEYLDGILGREEILLETVDTEKLKEMGFEPKTIEDQETGLQVRDLMLRCPCDDGYRWRFFISISEEGGALHLYGFRDRMMTRPGFEWREFNDLRRMSKFNAATTVNDWMIETLRTMLERDAVTIKEAEA